jgi:hypothetical protein
VVGLPIERALVPLEDAAVVLPRLSHHGLPQGIFYFWVRLGRASVLTTGDTLVGKKLYVGNLTYSVTSADLEQIFAEFGTVQSAQVIQDRETGRSKGFGFVEMGTDQEAQAAITGANLRQHDGRAMTVNEAQPRPEHSGRGRGGGGGGGRGRRY